MQQPNNNQSSSNSLKFELTNVNGGAPSLYSRQQQQ